LSEGFGKPFTPSLIRCTRSETDSRDGLPTHIALDDPHGCPDLPHKFGNTEVLLLCYIGSSQLRVLGATNWRFAQRYFTPLLLHPPPRYFFAHMAHIQLHSTSGGGGQFCDPRSVKPCGIAPHTPDSIGSSFGEWNLNTSSLEGTSASSLERSTFTLFTISGKGVHSAVVLPQLTQTMSAFASHTDCDSPHAYICICVPLGAPYCVPFGRSEGRFIPRHGHHDDIRHGTCLVHSRNISDSVRSYTTQYWSTSLRHWQRSII
jgi:hypothetical protein